MLSSLLISLLTLPHPALAQWYTDATESSYTTEESYSSSTSWTVSSASREINLENCQDLGWLSWSATEEEQEACAALLRETAQDAIDAADARGELRTLTHVYEEGEGRPAELTVYRGALDEELERRLTYYDPTVEDDRDDGYESDGDQIDDCAEYVYQRFYDYSQFQAAARALNDEYRGVADAAFDDAYIGAGALGIQGALGQEFTTYTGQVYSEDQFGPGPWTKDTLGTAKYVRAKNTFFELTEDEILAIEAIDDLRERAGLAELLREGQRYWLTDDEAMRSHTAPTTSGSVTIENRWQFHEVQSVRLADTSDAMLEYYRGKRQDFAKVLAHRRKLLADGASAYSVGDWVYAQQVDETLSGYDTALYNLLLEAKDLGCLDIATTERERQDGNYDFHGCDWAPRDLHDEVVLQAESLRQAALAECEAVADFDSLDRLSGYEWYDDSGTLNSERDPRSSVEAFRTYLARKQASQQNYIDHAVSTYDVQSQGIPWNSYAWSEGDTYGDTDYFAASWSAGLQWHLFNVAGGEVCDVNPYFKASGDVNVHVFSYKQEVLSALVDFHARKDRRKVDFEVLNYDLITETWENEGYATEQRLDYTYTYDDVWMTEQTFVQAQGSFAIWFIPVTVQGGVSGRIGVNYGFMAHLSEQQRIVDGTTECYDLYGQANAYARPFAALDGKAAVGIGVPGFSAGVYGRLTLAELSLPARVEVEALAKPDLSDITLDITVDADLEIETLSGELGLYADIFWSRHELELFRWRGAVYTQPILSSEFDIDLQVWGGVCTLPGVDCSG